MSKYFFEDKDIEEALLKVSIIFDNNSKMTVKKDTLFLKNVMSIIVSGNAYTPENIQKYLVHNLHGFNFDDQKIASALKELCDKKLIEPTSNNEYRLTKKVKDDSDNYLQKVKESCDNLVSRIYQIIYESDNRSSAKEQQIRQNIKDCINYYYETTSLSFFDIEKSKKIETLSKIKDYASKNLDDKKGLLANTIIYSIGCVLDNPSEEERYVLEILAKQSVTSKIMGVDPLLASFKATVLKDKVFILDTEVMLFLITDNARNSRRYKLMINKLLDNRCTIYVPQEVVAEVFDHAEAAYKRYPFVSSLIRSKDNLVVDELDNVFVEDYYYLIGQDGNEDISWKNYIDNFYDKDKGIQLIYEQLYEKLDGRIHIGTMPPNSSIIEDERLLLEKPAFDVTKETPKGQKRDDGKNWQIASTDVMLYLSAKYLNNMPINNSSSKWQSSSILNKTYYVLSSNTRIHYCAKNIGIADNVLCKPDALMAYLSEIGVLSKEEMKISSLFDNIFLIYTAKELWPDIENLLKIGVNLKGRSLVLLRNDLGDALEKLLVDEKQSEYDEVVKIIRSKGYTFDPVINVLADENQEKDKIIDHLRDIAETALNSQEKAERERDIAISERDKANERLEKEKRTKHYENKLDPTKTSSKKK